MRNIEILKTSLVMLSLVAVPSLGCDSQDDGADPQNRVENRDASNGCYNKGWKGRFVSGTFSTKYRPWGDDEPPIPDWPFHEFEYQRVYDGAIDALVTQFELSKAAGECELVCAEAGLDWQGQGCAFRADVEVGEPAIERGRNGYERTIEASGSIEPGCSCAR